MGDVFVSFAWFERLLSSPGETCLWEANRTDSLPTPRGTNCYWNRIALMREPLFSRVVNSYCADSLNLTS